MINDLIGKPFLSKGRGPDNYDCLGLIIEVYKRHNIIIPDFNIDAFSYRCVETLIQKESKKEYWLQIKEPEYLSIVTFKQHPKFVQHIGVCIESGNFIHASLHKGVTIDKLFDSVYKNSIIGFYKYVK